jgi:hypothetical protein
VNLIIRITISLELASQFEIWVPFTILANKDLVSDVNSNEIRGRLDYFILKSEFKWERCKIGGIEETNVSLRLGVPLLTLVQSTSLLQLENNKLNKFINS